MSDNEGEKPDSPDADEAGDSPPASPRPLSPRGESTSKRSRSNSLLGSAVGSGKNGSGKSNSAAGRGSSGSDNSFNMEVESDINMAEILENLGASIALNDPGVESPGRRNKDRGSKDENIDDVDDKKAKRSVSRSNIVQRSKSGFSPPPASSIITSIPEDEPVTSQNLSSLEQEGFLLGDLRKFWIPFIQISAADLVTEVEKHFDRTGLCDLYERLHGRADEIFTQYVRFVALRMESLDVGEGESLSLGVIRKS